MAKGLLVLAEMPKNCLDCELADCRYIPNARNSKMPYDIYCTAKEWKIADSWLDLNANDKRSDWCPLKELPARMCTDDNDLMGAYVEGYNKCLDEIEGVEECVMSSADSQKIREKLADYEDAEEQGRLIEFPVSIGQHLWAVDDYGCISELTVHELVQTSYEQQILTDSSGIITYYSLNHIGKNIFLTREQAEARLTEKEK